MITGEVNSRLEAIVVVRVRAADGSEVSVDAIVDTGFSEYLTLPAALIQALSLVTLTGARVRLADGSLRDVDVVTGSIWWNEEWRRIPIQVSEGDPLLGMSLLKKHFLSVEVIERGEVTIDERI